MTPNNLRPSDRRAFLRGKLVDIEEQLAAVKKGFRDAAGLPTADDVDILQALVAAFAEVHATIDLDLFASQRATDRAELAGAREVA